jgi:hypothetical protein
MDIFRIAVQPELEHPSSQVHGRGARQRVFCDHQSRRRPDMADSTDRKQLMAEIDELLKQQSESTANAIYLGWTREGEKEYTRRADHITVLRIQLADLES